MGQNKSLTKLWKLEREVPNNYVYTHGYFPETQTNVVTLTPIPATYVDDDVDPITKTLFPDKMITIKGFLPDVVEEFEQVLSKLND